MLLVFMMIIHILIRIATGTANIQSHLTAPISRETKWGMACFIVLMLDILSILPVLVNKVDFFTFAAVLHDDHPYIDQDSNRNSGECEKIYFVHQHR